MMSEVSVRQYSPEQVDSFLLTYEGLVSELPELAAAWDEMDTMERDHHRVIFGQAWGTRRFLGELFRAGQLTRSQESRLEELDWQLLEQGQLAQRCYGLNSRRLMKLFLWGTPLSLSRKTVRLEIETATLNEMALAWAGG